MGLGGTEMAGRVIREGLNGGIVQVRHPVMLQPGELQAAAECILRPGDTALHKAPGRTAYGTVRSVALSTTTANNTTLTAGAGVFGTDFTSVVRVIGSPIITKAAGFGVPEVDYQAGQAVVGTGIPAGAVIRRAFANGTDIELTLNASSSGTSTATICNTSGGLHPGMYIVGSGIPVVTTIASIQSATQLTMSNPATNALPASRTFSSQVQGLRALTFDHGFSDLLLAKADDKVYTSPLTTITGTFTELAHGLSQNVEAILETIQYRNRHVYLTGYDPPRVLYWKDSGSGKTVQERALGMQPVADFVGPAITTGSWSSLADFQNGWYYFLVTEVAIFGNNEEVESTYIGKPKGVQITTYTTQAITVTYTNTASQPVNDGNYGHNTATHWRVYMAPKQSEQFPVPDLSVFVRVAEVPIGTTSVTLADTNPSQAGYSAEVGADGANLALFPGGSTNAISQVAAQSKPCTIAGGSNILTAAAFGTVSAGMYINDANNRIPYGTTVIAVLPGATSLLMSKVATSSSSGTETVWFGNKSTFDSAFAVCPVNSDATRRGGIFGQFGIQNIGGFSTGTITGIQIDIIGRFLSGGADAGFTVEVARNKTSTFSTTGRVAQFKGLPSFATSQVTLGGQFDLWGVASWVPADFIDGATTFGVRLRKNYGSDGESLDHLIDGIKVTIYAGGNNINLDGEPFRTVIISDQLGQSFGSGARGPAPIASTGDVFDGMLLLNDTTDESVLCASLPDEEESFPDVYRIPIESKDNDKIRVIRKVQNIVVIGCLNSIKRLNYFPRETDPDFTRGRCYEDIASDHGMVCSRAAKLIGLQGAGSVLVYLSHDGLRFTDGVHTHFLNSDIDWQNLIEPTLIQRSVLEVYPKLSLLALYYVPAGQTRKIRVMYFSYHPTHVKPGPRLPAVGPVTCESGSAVSLLLNGKTYLMTGHSQDGKVYVEDSATAGEPVDASGGVIEPNIITRRFASTPGHTMRTERVFILTDADGTSTTGGFTALIFVQNEAQALTQVQSEVNKETSVGGLITLWLDNEAETFEVRLSKSESSGQTSELAIHYLGLEMTTDTTETNN